LNAIFETVWLRFDIHPEKTFLSPESSFIRSTVERISLSPPSYNTRIQRPKARFGVQILERIDHEPRKGLGEGAFGAVKLTVDLDSGRLLAVKQLKVDHEREKKEKEKAKSEVQIISTLEHVSAPATITIWRG
jgi:Protein kinase domain